MFEQDWVKSLNFNRQILGLLLLMISITFEFESSDGWEMRDRVQLWVGVLSTGHNTGPECLHQAATPLCHELSDQSDIMMIMISDQWWESPDPSSWPRILLGSPSPLASEEESEWLGDRWKVVFSMCTLCTEQCSHHQTWSMAGSWFVFTHSADLTSPAMSGGSVSSADTRCLQWSLVSTSADNAACSAESPAVQARSC